MRKEMRMRLLVPFTALVLLAAVALPLGVRADDATPPAPGTPDNALTAAYESTPTPTATFPPPDSEFSPTPAAALGVPTDDSTLPDGASTPVVAEIGSDALPADTTVAVLDSAGNQLPLASAEAAQIVASGDPIWCPVGYLPGDPECTPPEATITALIADLASMSGAGTIYFVATYSTNDAVLDGTDPSLSNLTDLTIQGGWNGLLGANFDLNGATEFSVPLSIVDWNGDVTLNDLIFNTTGSDGVYVTTSGKIELDNVESKGNSGRGAYLDNSSGGSTVGVTVSESSFHDNLTGLDIYTYGDVSLAYVDASYNAGVGGLLENAGNVDILEGSFTWNGLEGLGVFASGGVSFSDLAVRHNGSDGAWVLAPAGITIDGASFDQNQGIGLVALADDMLSLTDVTASRNDDSGLLLYSGNDVALKDVDASQNGGVGAGIWTDWNVRVDDSIFDENVQDGLYADSLYGDITVRCSEFLDNDGYGVNAVLPGTLGLRGNSFAGNGSGDYTLSGGGVAALAAHAHCDPDVARTPAPTGTPDTRMLLHVVHVVDGQIVTLDCASYRGTVLVLSNGDQVVLPCPITGQASLSSVERDELPAALESGLTFVSAMEVLVTPSLDGVMYVDFVIPFGQTNAEFSILRWDDTRWADLRGVRTAEGFFEALSSRDGVFVLVRE